MRKISASLFVAAALGAGVAPAQTTAPAPAPAAAAAPAATVKALQPGLLEVAGPRVNEVVAVGIEKITATPGKGRKSILVQSVWGDSYYGWPKNVKPVAFTIETGKPGGTATINAPGFNDTNKADYKAAIAAILPQAISYTQESRRFMEGSGR